MSAQHSAQDKVFLITGAASGLGAGFAERFLQEGAKHVAVWDVNEKAGLDTVAKLRARFGHDRASFTKCDVTDLTRLTEAFKEIVSQQGHIDVLINNAGILNDHPDHFRVANEVNWQALSTLSALAWQHMRADAGGRGGTIVNISSLAALVPLPYIPIYSGAKAAVLHFSKCLGMEVTYSRSRVRVLCMCFGATDTPLVQGIENKNLDEGMGRLYAEHEAQAGKHYQSVEAAVEGMSVMVREGTSGSVWLAMAPLPVKDITSHVNQAYEKIAETFEGILELHSTT